MQLGIWNFILLVTVVCNGPTALILGCEIWRADEVMLVSGNSRGIRIDRLCQVMVNRVLGHFCSALAESTHTCSGR